MATGPFTCTHATAWLPDYVAGRLGLTELALIEMHLTQCPACRRASQELAAEADPSPPRIRHRRWRPGRLIVPAASTVTRAIGGIVAGRPRSPESLPVEVPSLRREPPSRQGASSRRRQMDLLRHAASTLRARVPSVPSVPSLRRWPHGRPTLRPSPSSTGSLVRIGTALIALALVGGVWWLPAGDGSLASAPVPPAPASAPAEPAPPMATTAEPVAAPEVAGPAPVVPPRPRPRSSTPAQSADRSRAPSPPPESAVPPPEWIPPGGTRSDAPRETRAPTQGDQVQPAPSSPDPAAAVDWLLRGDGRGSARRGRAETP